MGFFRRLVGGRGRQPSESDAHQWPPPGPITTWPVGESFSSKFPAVVFLPRDNETVGVEGESECRATLDLIAPAGSAGVGTKPGHVAALLPEPTNPNDPEAVRVVIIPTRPRQPWGKVGYLSSEDGARYRPLIDRVAAMGRVTACHVSLTAAEGSSAQDRGPVSVTLHLDTPKNLMLKLDRQKKSR